MIDFDFNEYCSGCGACFNICPVGAIEMKSDKVGFLFPNVNKDRCICCGLCDDVCSHMNAGKYKKEPQNGVWLYSSNDDEAKMKSSSGAAFFELAKKVIENNGVVVGCSWNENLVAEHILVDKLDELEKLQGSKQRRRCIRESF